MSFLYKRVRFSQERVNYSVPYPVTSENSLYISMPFVQQYGPQCGICAICMIAASVDIRLKPSDLVEEARKLGFSNHGEMFSAANMVLLAQKYLKDHFQVILQNNLSDHSFETFKTYLNKGCLILVPYDCDKNNEPCMVGGANAHWAIICGYISDGSSDPNDLFVYACHSKSQYVSVWNFKQFVASNHNLCDIGAKRRADGIQYVLPSGNLQVGLAYKWILIEQRTDNFV